ncbi:MAG: hypothetical protein KY442_08370 [Proteobacteria bacterium]|nr:hypothetical protein [Pseudomonadota bacterium]
MSMSPQMIGNAPSPMITHREFPWIANQAARLRKGIIATAANHATALKGNTERMGVSEEAGWSAFVLLCACGESNECGANVRASSGMEFNVQRAMLRSPWTLPRSVRVWDCAAGADCYASPRRPGHRHSGRCSQIPQFVPNP